MMVHFMGTLKMVGYIDVGSFDMETVTFTKEISKMDFNTVLEK